MISPRPAIANGRRVLRTRSGLQIGLLREDGDTAPLPAEACTDFGADFPRVPRRRRAVRDTGPTWTPIFVATVWPLLALLAMAILVRCSQ